MKMRDTLNNTLDVVVIFLFCLACLDPVVCFAQKSDDISTEKLSKMNGYSGEKRDIWLSGEPTKKKTEGELTEIVSLEKNSPYLTMLSMPNMQKSLEMVESQIREIKEAQKNSSIQLQKLAETFKSATPKERKEIIKQAHKLVESFDNDIKSIILPHQWNALSQISLREHISRRGLFNVLVSGPVGVRLKVSHEQRKNLSEEAKQIRDEMQNQIKKMHAEAIERMLSKLTTEQRRNLRDLLGQEYENSIEPNFFRLVSQLDSVADCKGCGELSGLPMLATPRESGQSVLDKNKE